MPKIMEKNFLAAEFARQVFRITSPAGVSIEEIIDPSYWAHVARRLTPYDIIEVVPEDGAFYARLIVVNTGKLFAKVQIIEKIDLNTPVNVTAAIAMNLFDTKYAGPNAKWRVIRKSDNAVVSKEPFGTQQEAEEWLEKNIKDMAA